MSSLRFQGMLLLAILSVTAPLLADPKAGTGEKPKGPIQEEGAPLRRDDKVTINVTNRPLREVLGMLAPQEVRVEKDVPDIRLTLNLRDVSRAAAIRMVVRQSTSADRRIRLTRDGNVFRIFLGEPIPEEMEVLPVPIQAVAPILSRSVKGTFTGDLKKEPLHGAVGSILAGTGLQFVVTPEVREIPITLNVRDVSLGAVLNMVVRQANSGTPVGETPPLELVGMGDVLVFRKATKPAPRSVEEVPVTFSVKDQPLREVVKLFRGVKVRVEEGVPDVPITLNIRDVLAPEALQIIVRQAKDAGTRLTVTLEEGAYVIRRAKE